MFDVGFTEILLIGVVSLVVIGPERLPDVARTAGKWIGKMQRFVRGVKTDIANELDSGELKKLIGDQREQLDELRKVVGSTTRELESSTRDAVRSARKKLTELEDAASRTEGEADADADVTRPSGPSTPPVPPAPTAPRAEPATGSTAAAARAIGGHSADAAAPTGGGAGATPDENAGASSDRSSSERSPDVSANGARDAAPPAADATRQSGSGT